MATVSENSRHSYVDPDQFVRYQLDQTRRRIKSTDLLVALVLVGLLLVGYVLVFTLLDHWVISGGFRPVTRLVLLSLVVTALLAILYRSVVRRLDAQVNPLFAARVLDQSHADPDGSLLTLVDLQTSGRQPGAVIQKTLEKRAALQLVQVHVDEAVDRRSLVRLGTALFVLMLLTCLYAVFSPKSISLLRPLTLAETHVATRTILESILPGNTSVPAGSHLQFQVDVSGIIPEDVRVLYTTADRRFVDEPLVMQATADERRFQVILPGESNRGVRQNLQYRIVAGDASSDLFQVQVIQPPSAQVTSVRYQFPEYMKLPDRVEQSGMLDAWQDTSATITAESNVPLRSAVLQLSDDPSFASPAAEIPVTVEQTRLSANLKLQSRADGTFPKYYRIQVTDLEDHHDPEPVVYTIAVQPDQAPLVRLLDPSRDLQVAANAIVPLLVEAEDPDFLLRNISLHYAVNGQPRQPAEFLMDASSSGFVKRWAGSWDFQLSLLRLNPGDIVTYHIEARDNRPPLGNAGRTGELNLRIEAPLPDDQVRQQLAQDREMQEQQLQDRRERQQQSGSQEQSLPQQEAAEQPLPENSATGADDNTASPTPSDPRQGSRSSQNPEKRPTPNSSDTPQKSDPATPEASENNPSDASATPPNESPSRQPAEDDEALQRLIESMNQQPESSDTDTAASSGNQSASAPNGANGQSQAQKPSPNSQQPGSEQQTGSEDSPGNEPPSAGKTPGGDSARPSAAENDAPATSTPKQQPGEDGQANNADPSDPQPADSPNAESATSKTNPSKAASDDQPSGSETSKTGESQPKSSRSGDKSTSPDPSAPTTDPAASPTTQPQPERGQQDQTQPAETPGNPPSDSTDPSQQPDQNAANPQSENGQGTPQKGETSQSAKSSPNSPKAGKTSQSASESSSQESENTSAPSSSEQQSGTNNPSSGTESSGSDSSADSGANQSGSQQGSPADNPSPQDSPSAADGSSKSNGNSDNGSPSATGQSGSSAAQKKAGSQSAGSQKSGGGAAAGGSPQNGNSATESSSRSSSADGQKSGTTSSANSESSDTQDQKQEPSGGAKNGTRKPAGKTSSTPDQSSPEKSDSGADDQSSEKTSEPRASDDSEDARGAGKKSRQGGKAGQASQDDAAENSQPGGAQSADQSAQPDKQDKRDDTQNGSSEKSSSNEPESTDDGQPEGQKSGGQSGGQQQSDRGGEGGARKAGAQQSGGGKQPGGGGKGAIGAPGATGGVQAGSGDSPQTSSPSEDSPGDESPRSAPRQPGTKAGGAPQRDDTQPVAEGDSASAAGTSESPSVDPAQQPSDAEVDNAARAAGLALKRLQKELDRGEVDQKLLDQLGWTKADLEAFTRRMQQQLQERELNSQQLHEKSLSRKSFEEMLRSLDVKSQGKTREGSTTRDRDRQDTTGRQSTPPARYRNSFDAYQRSLSGAGSPQ